MKVSTYLLNRGDGPKGGSWPIVIVAASDKEAIAKAKTLTVKGGGELWLFDRKVADL